MRLFMIALLALAAIPSQRTLEASEAPCRHTGTETLRERLIRHEGYRDCAYEDTLGNPTIGIGHLLRKPVSEDLCWSREQIDHAFHHDLDRAKTDADHAYGFGFGSLPPQVRDVLTEMAFQLGGAGLSRFRKFLLLIRAGHYQDAADDLLTTRLAQQAPNRIKELSCLLGSASSPTFR